MNSKNDIDELQNPRTLCARYARAYFASRIWVISSRCVSVYILILNPFTLSGLFYINSLDRSIPIEEYLISFYYYYVLYKFLYLMQAV